MRGTEWNTFNAVKAAKYHYCEWCHLTPGISKGEEHLKFIGSFEGEFQSWRIHTDCRKAMDKNHHRDDQLCNEGHEKGQPCDETDHR